MEARVAVLEQIAKGTKEILVEMRQDARDLRAEARGIRADLQSEMKGLRAEMRDLRAEHRSDFRWLLGLGITATGFLLAADGGLFALIVRGFHGFR